MVDEEKRRAALQIASQLPPHAQDARDVLAYAATIIEGFFIGGDSPVKSPPVQPRRTGQ